MSGRHNNGLHQTRRGGAAATRPVVEARLAGEAECYPGQTSGPRVVEGTKGACHGTER